MNSCWNAPLGGRVKDFSISFPADTDRAAYRASAPGLTARLPGGLAYEVKDLSVNGISLVCSGIKPSDKIIEIDLLLANRLYLSKLSSQLVRGGTSGVAAFSFVGLTQQQEERLDKLVLSIQKQRIEMRKVHGL